MTDKRELVQMLIEEEASVLEMARALARQFPQESIEEHQRWLCETLLKCAARDEIGFFLDEFGAREEVPCTLEQAQAEMEGSRVWSIESDVMLHVTPLG